MDAKGSRFLKGILSLATSGLLSLFLGLGNFTLAARFIPQDDFGAFFILFAVVQLMESLSDMGLRLSAPKFLSGAETPEARGNMARSIITAKLCTTGLMIGVILLLKGLIVAIFANDLLDRFYIYLPFLYLTMTADLFMDAMMQGHHLYTKMAVVRSLSSICQFVLVVILIWPMHLGVHGYILAIIISFVLSASTQFLMLPGPRLPGFDWAFLKEFAHFSYPLAGNNILSFLYRRLDLLIVGALMTPEMVALVGVARRIPETLERLYSSFFAVYFPHVSELCSQGDLDVVSNFVNRTLRLITAITCLGSAFTILFSREIVSILFSSIYTASAPVMDLFMAAFTIAQASSVLTYTVLARGRSGYIPVVSLLESMINIGSNFLLIPALGPIGTGLARVVSVGLANVAMFIVTLKASLSTKGRNYLPFLLLLGLAILAKALIPSDDLALRAGAFILFLVTITISSRETLNDLRGFARMALSRQASGD